MNVTWIVSNLLFPFTSHSLLFLFKPLRRTDFSTSQEANKGLSSYPSPK